MDFVARFLGRRLAYTYEIVDLVPGERLVMRTAQGPFPMETTYGWQPVDHARTRMTLRNRGEPAGFGKIAAPVLAAAIRRANVKDLAALKQLLGASRARSVVSWAPMPRRVRRTIRSGAGRRAAGRRCRLHDIGEGCSVLIGDQSRGSDSRVLPSPPVDLGQ
jgi:hypothetical protein